MMPFTTEAFTPEVECVLGVYPLTQHRGHPFPTSESPSPDPEAQPR